MRLICPNCGAQYKVDERAIPEAGRDVQCSNCGHGWFQTRSGLHEDPEFGPEFEETPEPTIPVAAKQDPVPEPEPVAEVAPEAEPEVEPEPEPVAPPARPLPQRRTLDDEVLSVLREEAEREKQARQAEAQAPIESQPELGVEAPKRADPIVPAAVEEKPVDDDSGPVLDQSEEGQVAAAAVLASKSAARRDLLPDIEEINSSLRPDAAHGGEDEEDGESAQGQLENRRSTKRSGFRIGFVLTLLIALGALLAYTQASEITQQFPQLAAPLERYVDTVNASRLWLDRTVLSAINSES
jgi:predicted Zn finger-like uncharacterized protein